MPKFWNIYALYNKLVILLQIKTVVVFFENTFIIVTASNLTLFWKNSSIKNFLNENIWYICICIQFDGLSLYVTASHRWKHFTCSVFEGISG